MRKGMIATICALAVMLMMPAQAGDTRLPLNTPEKAAFCGIESALGLIGDVIEHQGCPATKGVYDFDVTIGFDGTGTVDVDNLTLRISLDEESSKGEIWKVRMPNAGSFDNVGIDAGSVKGHCSNTTFGEIIIGGGDLTIGGTKYDWVFIKDLYDRRLNWRDEKLWTITDKGLEVITKLGYPRQKYRQVSKYRRADGGDGRVYIKKTRITPSNAPDCRILIPSLRADNWASGFRIFEGRVVVK